MIRETTLVVGLGASAGGIEALKAFFGRIPDDPDMAFVVVTHLSPDHKSMLRDVVRGFTPLSVEVIEDGDPLRAGVVHVMPEGVALSIRDGRLRLIEVDAVHRERKPVDVFFSALASDQREQAVGIVLSGGDGDGTLGVQAIKKHGGITFAQATDSTFAQAADVDGPGYPQMPESAIASGWVDFALPAERMAEKLLEIQQIAAEAGADLRRGELAIPQAEKLSLQDQISDLLRSHSGRDFAGYKSRTFFRRVARRMQVVTTSTPADYLERLRQDPAEVMALFRDLLISVTDFFRDDDAFQALQEHVLPRLLAERGAHDTLRVWVPGCATGEEVYSLAMLIREQMDGLSSCPQVKIFATDIDAAALTVARAGRFPESLLENVSADRKARFFRRDGASQILVQEIREMCVFSSHSLISDPPFSRMDLVSCRNLLIYLGSELQQQVIPTFHYALKPGGFLFLGSSESLNQYQNLFTPIDKKHRIFQSLDLGDGRPRMPIPVEEMRVATHSFDQPERPQRTTNHRIRQRAEHQVMERHSPAHVVIRSEGEIVFYSARTRRYFDTPRGAPNRQLFELVQRELRQDLRSLLREARETGKPALRHSVMPDEEAALTVAVSVEPLENGEGGEALFLVVFRPVGTLRGGKGDAGPTAAGQADSDDTERELLELHERLRSTVEEYETALEELNASNEELVSVNEEAQSTNEELQASKEEMQSLNEELSTVNAELNDKLEELDRQSTDMRNLYDATGISSIFLDGDLTIRNFTPAAAIFFKLRDADLGRPLTELAGGIEYPALKVDAHRVLETGQPVERRLAPNGQAAHYLVRSAPYFDKGKTTGVVITFVDITTLAEAEEQRNTLIAEAAEAELRLQRSQKMEAIGQLTGGVAHDFNNLLMIILGNAEGLSDALQDSPLKAMADNTLMAAERGGELISRLMAFSRLQPLAPQTIDINASVSKIKDMIRQSVTAEIEVELALDPELWNAEVDPSQLEVALLNLVTNARHAMPDGGTLTIETGNIVLEEASIDGEHDIDPGHYVLLNVADTGAGMSEEVQRRVFEPFFTTKDETKGSGLGLPSVYGFVKQSRGHIRIYSKVGEGTSVRLYLPRAAGRELDTAESDLDETPHGNGEKILVVEDDIGVRALATRLIRRLGYDVIEAATGPEAIEILKSDQPLDMLFTDVVMPGGMNGRQLAKAALEIRPDLKVLYTSGYSEEVILDHDRLPSDVVLLSKPYRLKPLAQTIRSVLTRR